MRFGLCIPNRGFETVFTQNYRMVDKSDLHCSLNYHQIRNKEFEYNAVFYNRKQPHSWINGSSPENFEIKHQPLNMCAYPGILFLGGTPDLRITKNQL